MGLGARIGTGLAAAGAAAGGAVAPLANENDHNPTLTQDIPAHYKSVDYQSPMDQYQADGNNINHSPEPQSANLQEPVEAEESQPSTRQKIGELGRGVEDIADMGAEAGKRKDEAEKIGEQSNTLNKPELADNRDVNLTQEAEQNADNGQNYYSGYGY